MIGRGTTTLGKCPASKTVPGLVVVGAGWLCGVLASLSTESPVQFGVGVAGIIGGLALCRHSAQKWFSKQKVKK